MPDCTTCKHSNTLHNADGTCSIDGCACDELALPAMAPDVDPPKPGACLHIGGGAIWVVDSLDEIDEALDASLSFCKFTACDFEEKERRKVFTTFPLRVRPEAIGSYHGFPQERWDAILEAIR